MTTNRTRDGCFAPRFCPDPNCGGMLVRDVERSWAGENPILRCDGLTHVHDDGPLVACTFALDAAQTQQDRPDAP